MIENFNSYKKVSIADYKVTTSPDKLSTLGLGSCIGVCIFDINKKIGGLAHILLPTKESIPLKKTITENILLKYADYTIPKMVDEMISLGCRKSNLQAVVVGGGNMFQNNQGPSVGSRNYESAVNILNSLKIPILVTDVGGKTARSIFFDLSSGEVILKKKDDMVILHKFK